MRHPSACLSYASHTPSAGVQLVASTSWPWLFTLSSPLALYLYVTCTYLYVTCMDLFLGAPLFIVSLRHLDHAKLQAGFYPTVPGNPPEWAQNYQIFKQVAPDPAAAWRGPP